MKACNGCLNLDSFDLFVRCRLSSSVSTVFGLIGPACIDLVVSSVYTWKCSLFSGKIWSRKKIYLLPDFDAS